MKVRVCPQCGKHNLENAFSCVECGTTLSIKTLLDLESDQFSNVKSIAGETRLSEISAYFGADVEETLKWVKNSTEKIEWGFNLSQAAQDTPMRERTSNKVLKFFDLGRGLPSFLFGYFILTSERLICVYFTCEVSENGFPKRQCFLNPRLERIMPAIGESNFSSRGYLVLPIPAIDAPGYPLTDVEKKSRKVVIYELRDLSSVRTFESTVDQKVRYLKLKFKKDEEVEFAFKLPEYEEKAYKMFNSKLKK